jgi:multiple antibiotic resistance protein
MMTLDQVISAFVTLLVLVDPPGLGLILLSLTPEMPSARRRALAVQACLIALLVLVGSALIGNLLLSLLGIGIPAFRVAGGLLLFAIAFEMVFSKRQERKASELAEAQYSAELAAFPIAVPLIAGPGSITACILLAGRAGQDPLQIAILIGIILLVILVTLPVLALSSGLERIMGVSGQVVFAKLTGVLLAALAMQFVLDGLTELRLLS